MSSGVADVIAAVLDGRISYDDGVAELSAVTDDRSLQVRRAEEVLGLFGAIEREDSALRVRDTSRLGAAAARMVAPGTAPLVLLSGAIRLTELGTHRSALALLDEAEPLVEGQDRLQLYIRQVRLQCLVEQGQHEAVDAAVNDLLADAAGLDADDVVCMVLLERAESLAAAGRPGDALEIARTALAIRRRLAPDDEVSPVLYSLPAFALRCGNVARQAGGFEDALAIFEEGRADAMAGNNPPDAALLLSEIGFTWGLAGDRIRSRNLLKQAATEADALGRADWSANWRNEIRDDGAAATPSSIWQRANALSLHHPERATEAIDLFRACVADARRRGDGGHEGDSRNNLGVALDRAGQHLQGELAFRAAIRCAERIGDRLREIRYRTNLAAHFVRLRRIENAEQEIAPALEIGERLRSEASSVEMRQTLGAALAGAYDVVLLGAAVSYRPGRHMVPAGEEPAWRRPRLELLLDIGQRSRATNFVESLRIGALVDGDGAPDQGDEMVRAVLDARAAEVAVELAAAENGPVGPAITERNAAAGRLRTVAARRGVTLSGTHQPATIPELEAALHPDEVFVDLPTHQDGVAFFCMRPGATPRGGFCDWKLEERRKLLHRLVRCRREVLAADFDGSAEDRTETHRALEDALSALDEILLARIAEEVAGLGAGPPARLFVSPENELFQLPFWRLSALVGPGAGPPVSVLPTPAALPVLRARQRTGGHPWVAVADPSRSLRYTRQDVPVDAGFRWCDARPKALLAELPAAGRIHLACHGVFDARSTHRSGLVVEPDDGEADPLGARHRYGTTDLALFTAAQVVGRLFLSRCELAVLAACDSGLPRQHDASEFTGLPGAFLVAGARNVVASLWPAHDGAAALLMATFYTALADGSSRVQVAAALAAARSSLAGLSRADVVARLGEGGIPAGDRPFAASLYTDCFQHYGVD